jgi:transposase
MACSAHLTVVPWPSKSSTATLAIRRVVEHQRTVLQVALGQRRLDGGLAPQQPVERGVEFVVDGLYIVRTSLPAETLGDADTVRSYKSLARVERAFRCIKTVDLNVRPVYHWLEDRVRAHVLLCMLAYYLEWHMRQCLAPMLFDDTYTDEAEALRSSVVAPAQRSKAALKKQTTGMTPDGLPVHSFHTLLVDLATMARNTISTVINPLYPLTVVTRPTPVQQKAFDLLRLAV